MTRDPDFEEQVHRLGEAVSRLVDPRQLTFLDILDAEAKKEEECPSSSSVNRTPTCSTPSK